MEAERVVMLRRFLEEDAKKLRGLEPKRREALEKRDHLQQKLELAEEELRYLQEQVSLLEESREALETALAGFTCLVEGGQKEKQEKPAAPAAPEPQVAEEKADDGRPEFSSVAEATRALVCEHRTNSGLSVKQLAARIRKLHGEGRLTVPNLPKRLDTTVRAAVAAMAEKGHARRWHDEGTGSVLYAPIPKREPAP